MAKQLYIGTKVINASEMTLGMFNHLMNRATPSDKDPTEPGYLVEYQDGGAPNTALFDKYVSWSPKEVFEKAYKVNGKLPGHLAIAHLGDGGYARRNHWHPEEMVYYVPANEYKAVTPTAKTFFGEEAMVPYKGYFARKTRDRSVEVYALTADDLMANDWTIYNV